MVIFPSLIDYKLRSWNAVGCIQNFLCSWILHWGYIMIIIVIIIIIIIIIIIVIIIYH